MRVMVVVKATKSSEAGVMAGADVKRMLTEMGIYNEERVKAGIMQSGDGLKPSSCGKREVRAQEERLRAELEQKK